MDYRSKSGSGVILTSTNRLILDKYMSEIAKLKPLSREEEQELFVRIKRDNDQAAIEKICKHNLLFVVTVARRYSEKLGHSKSLALEDLINEGNVGLCEAVERFDPETGFKFISYAVWYIRMHILKSIQDNVKTIKISTNAKNKIDKLNKLRDELEQKNSMEVSLMNVYEELMDSGELKNCDTYGKISQYYKLSQYESSLNEKSSLEGSIEIGDLIEDDCIMQPDDILIQEDKKNIINEILGVLDETRLNYIKHYFGLDGFEQLSVKEISKKYDINEPNLNYLFKKTFKELKSKNKRLLKELR